MNNHISPVGERVRIIHYSPFRNMKGTIQRVHTILDDDEDPFCFYLVLLDSLHEPLWFEHTEIEALTLPSLALLQQYCWRRAREGSVRACWSLIEMDGHEADLHQAHLGKCSLTRATLSGADFIESTREVDG